MVFFLLSLTCNGFRTAPLFSMSSAVLMKFNHESFAPQRIRDIALSYGDPERIGAGVPYDTVLGSFRLQAASAFSSSL